MKPLRIGVVLKLSLYNHAEEKSFMISFFRTFPTTHYAFTD